MAEDNQKALERFRRSCIYAIVAVIVSTLAVLVLRSMSGPRNASVSAASGIDVAADILGLPLAPGWFIVCGIFGEWSVIHGTQIFWIWPLSVAIDTLVIFLVWEFLQRKMSRGFDRDNILPIDR